MKPRKRAKWRWIRRRIWRTAFDGRVDFVLPSCPLIHHVSGLKLENCVGKHRRDLYEDEADKSNCRLGLRLRWGEIYGPEVTSRARRGPDAAGSLCGISQCDVVCCHCGFLSDMTQAVMTFLIVYFISQYNSAQPAVLPTAVSVSTCSVCLPPRFKSDWWMIWWSVIRMFFFNRCLLHFSRHNENQTLHSYACDTNVSSWSLVKTKIWLLNTWDGNICQSV